MRQRFAGRCQGNADGDAFEVILADGSAQLAALVDGDQVSDLAVPQIRGPVPPRRSRLASRDARCESGVVGTSGEGGRCLNTLVSVETARAGRPLTTIGSAALTSAAFDRSP